MNLYTLSEDGWRAYDFFASSNVKAFAIAREQMRGNLAHALRVTLVRHDDGKPESMRVWRWSKPWPWSKRWRVKR